MEDKHSVGEVTACEWVWSCIQEGRGCSAVGEVVERTMGDGSRDGLRHENKEGLLRSRQGHRSRVQVALMRPAPVVIEPRRFVCIDTDITKRTHRRKVR